MIVILHIQLVLVYCYNNINVYLCSTYTYIYVSIAYRKNMPKNIKISFTKGAGIKVINQPAHTQFR